MLNTQYMAAQKLFKLESKETLKHKEWLFEQASKQLKEVSSRIFYSLDLTGSLSIEILFFTSLFFSDLPL